MAIFDQNEQLQRNHQKMSVFNLSIQNRLYARLGSSGRSGVTVNGPWGLNWTVQMTESGRSWDKKVNGPNALIFMDRPLQHF